ncbi:MAG: transcription-repair coupling factor, partial [Ignavibacteriaceae bacterium]|nr:transcription-repair coupling factor [Ignavibacteriaceae bacterium]
MKSKSLNRILNISAFGEVLKKLQQQYQSAQIIRCSSLYGVSRSLLVLRLNEIENQSVLLLHDSKAAEELFVELNQLGLTEQVILFEEFNPESVQEKLTKISRQKKFILISTYELLHLKIPAKEHIHKNTTVIQAGGQIKYDELIEYLNLLNFQRDNFVEAPGEFSVRGSIIDFWSHSEHIPVRLEFDGDFLESIRSFDPESQRSFETVDTVSLAASFEKGGESTSDIFEYLEDPIIV